MTPAITDKLESWNPSRIECLWVYGIVAGMAALICAMPSARAALSTLTNCSDWLAISTVTPRGERD